MGSKGNQVSTQSQQSYTPNPLIAGAGQQALSGAQTAAQAPFSMPQAPVAGFQPLQQQAFGQTQALQGMAQPYFNQGQQYLQQSAAPISASQVANYYNPMASNVTAQMQNIFGQQQQATTGQLTQAAGGVGADRIAVGQSELANQQGLAAGQTYAGLYQQALQGAQQQNQMAAGAGYGISQMGPAAMNAQLAGTGALGAAGSQQQQLQQAQMNAPYQQQLAQIAYPFQTAQYLAGITGGLAPAFGGTTQGQSTTTYPTPSPLAQGLGIGTSLLGAAGGMGAFGGGSGKGSSPTSLNAGNYGGTGGGLGGLYRRGGRTLATGGPSDPMDFPISDSAEPVPFIPFTPESNPGSGANLNMNPPSGGSGASGGSGGIGQALGAIAPLAMMFLRRGGKARADGGSTYGKLEDIQDLKDMSALNVGASTGNPYDMAARQDFSSALPHFDDGGDVQPQQQQGLPFPGASVPKIGGASPIPFISMPMGSGQGTGNKLSLQHQYPTMPGMQTGTTQDVNAAMRMAQMLGRQYSTSGGISSGGAVNPYDIGQHFDDGGNVYPIRFGVSKTADALKRLNAAGETNQGRAADYAASQLQREGYDPVQIVGTQAKYASGGYADGGDTFDDRFSAADNLPQMDQVQPGENPYAALAGGMEALKQPALQHLGLGQPVNWDTAQQNAPEMIATGATPETLDNVGDTNIPPHASLAGPASTYPAPQRSGPNADMNANQYMMPQGQQPYPDATQRDWGQNATRSPWMALVKAGAQMAQTRGPIGSVIGAGISAGAGELEGQRKELRSEQDINDKAQQLYQQAKIHLDQYQRMTPYQAQEAAKPVVVAQTVDAYGRTHSTYGQRQPDGTFIDPITHKPIDSSTISGGNQSSGVDPTTLTGEPFLKTLPPGMANMVRQLARGDISPTSIGYRDRTAILAAASQYDPSYNTYTAPQRAQAAKNFTGSGVEARNFTSNDMAIQHIGSGLDNLEKLGNYSSEWANVVTGAPSPKLGYNKPYQAAFSAMNTDADAIGNELMRSFRGSGSASEKEATEWRKNFNPYASPVIIRAAFQEAAKLLGGRISAAGSRYNDAMGPLHARDPLSWMSDKGRAAYDRAVNLDPQNPTPPSGSPSAAATQPEISVGTEKQFKQGTGVWNGTQWVPKGTQ